MNFTNGGSIMNEFVDMHVHSKFSIDGMSTMEDYCLIAGKTGTRVTLRKWQVLSEIIKPAGPILE